MHDWDSIFGHMHARRNRDSKLIRQMVSVSERYNGDIVIPLPDVEGQPDMPAPMPNLVAEAIDSTALRASSVAPMIHTPADTNTSASKRRAAERKRVWYGRWYESGLNDILLGRLYRHWTGYGTAVLAAKPRLRKGDRPGAKIELHDPLTCYPEARTEDDHRPVRNIGMVYGVSRQWLLSRYPEQVRPVMQTHGRGVGSDVLWDVVEWWDEDHRVMGLLGPRTEYVDYGNYGNMAQWGGIELSRVPNKAGMVPVVAPRRLTLSRIEGQVAKMLQREDMLGRMYALEYLAAEKSVFPDMYVLGENGQQPQLVHGRWIDGREGDANLVMDAQGIGQLRSDAGVSAFAATDRLERSARMAGGASPLSNAESPGASIRSGRGFEAAASLAIDPRVQEAQRVVARHLSTLNEGIGAVEKGWFGGKKLWAFSAWGGSAEKTEYKPNDLYDTTLNVVEYAFPGADLGQINVIVSQAVGAELMSKGTAARKHPMIGDPEAEQETIINENLTNALLSGVAQRAASGELPEVDLANIQKAVDDGKTLAEAVQEADRKARERQSEEAQPQTPEAAPGLANPGVGAEGAPPAEPPGQFQSQTGSDLQDLRQLLFDVRQSSPQ